MSGTTTNGKKATAEKQPELTPEQMNEINVILARARQGDEGVLPELQRVLDEYPGIWVRAGNVAAHARSAWLRLIGGSDYLVKESADRYSDAQINLLVGKDASPMERLLAERIVLCRLQVSHAEHMMTQLAEKASIEVAAALDKRISVCQKRLSGAVTDLARHQKVFGCSGQPVASTTVPAPPVDITPPSPVSSQQPIDITPPMAPLASAQGLAMPAPTIDPSSLDMSEEAIEARIRAEWDAYHGIQPDHANHRRNGNNKSNGFNNRIKDLLEPTVTR